LHLACRCHAKRLPLEPCPVNTPAGRLSGGFAPKSHRKTLWVCVCRVCRKRAESA
jgi:hypothetical protein